MPGMIWVWGSCARAAHSVQPVELQSGHLKTLSNAFFSVPSGLQLRHFCSPHQFNWCSVSVFVVIFAPYIVRSVNGGWGNRLIPAYRAFHLRAVHTDLVVLEHDLQIPQSRPADTDVGDHTQ